MIYFGWDGWGPWNTPAGSIWFVLGFMFWVGLRPLLHKFVIKGSGARHDIISALLLFWIFWMGAMIGGYYGWFSGVTAQVNSSNAYIKEINDHVAKWKADGCK